MSFVLIKILISFSLVMTAAPLYTDEVYAKSVDKSSNHAPYKNIADPKQPPHTSEISIKGSEVTYDIAKDIANIKGDVKIKRSFRSKNSSPNSAFEIQTLTADKVEVFLKKDSKQTDDNPKTNKQSEGLFGSSKISKINAKGHVKFVYLALEITADKGFYDPSSNIIQCEKNVVMKKAGNILYGDVATADLNSNICKITNKKKSPNTKVKAVLFLG